MKKFLCISFLALFFMGNMAMAAPKATPEQQVAYVVKTMRLSGEKSTKLKAELKAYYKELEEVKAAHKALKKKYKNADDLGKLTSAQCEELFASKQKQEKAELDLKAKYYGRFKSFLTVPQAYDAIRLSNDKLE